MRTAQNPSKKRLKVSPRRDLNRPNKTFDWHGFWKGIFYALLTLALIFSLFMAFFENTETYKNIVYPSYLSVVSVCEPQGSEIVESLGYIPAGQFNLTDQTITIFVEDLDGKVMRHEKIHEWQNLNNRYYGCENRIFMLLNEIQANLGEDLSDDKFIEKYGNFCIGELEGAENSLS